MRLMAGGLIVIVLIYGILEVGRWNRPVLADMLSPLQKARRLVGLILLFILGLMLWWGAGFPRPITVPLFIQRLELLYWLSASLLIVFILFIAFFEFKDSLIRASQLRRETYREIVTAPLDSLHSDADDVKKTPPQ